MKVTVNNETKELKISDPKTGLDYSSDFCERGHYPVDSEGNSIMTAEEFEGWKEEIDLQEKYDAIEKQLKNDYGMDEYDIRNACIYNDRSTALQTIEELLRVMLED